jgi:uncharacterized protein YndB with AHSA1/START domain
MEKEKTVITVEVTVNAPVEKVWEYWTSPEHIVQWNHASDDWHTSKAENDLQTGGRFFSRMDARDGSFGFDFEGVYDDIQPHSLIAYSLSDGRQVRIIFEDLGDKTRVIESFDAENENPIEMQKEGWQAILSNFKKYAE